jgi:hypothetical protein
VTPEAQWWFISDLHLASDGAQPRRTSEAFAAFLETVVLAGRTPVRHLVMLGDTFDLAGQDAVAELNAMADRHLVVFDAWRACLRDGTELHFVCGNHDLDLATTPVWNVLHDLLSGDRISVHPWAARPGGTSPATATARPRPPSTERPHTSPRERGLPTSAAPDPTRSTRHSFPSSAWRPGGAEPWQPCPTGGSALVITSGRAWCIRQAVRDSPRRGLQTGVHIELRQHRMDV